MNGKRNHVKLHVMCGQVSFDAIHGGTSYVALPGKGRDAGELKLEVSGMTCGSCVATVKAALERSPGVRKAHVALGHSPADLSAFDGLAIVTLHVNSASASGPTPRSLVALVEAVGFDARVAVAQL
jgi:copper chaperone CopZ